LISGFQFRYDIDKMYYKIFDKISRYQYQYFKNDKYVNLIQAQKQECKH